MAKLITTSDARELDRDPWGHVGAAMKVGIAHPFMRFGGSEARAMWGIEALRGDHQVSLLTGGTANVDGLNAFYGTSLRASDFDVRRTTGLARVLGRGDTLRGALFQRFCRDVAKDFDVLVSAYNPIDFGVPALQFVADFSWQRQLREELDPIPRHAQRFIHRSRRVRQAYVALGRRLERPSTRDPLGGQDLVVANSEFTAEVLRNRCGVSDAPVIYPPVGGGALTSTFEEREEGFVCLGRISYEKRIERIVAILARVRSLGHDVHLHVAGATPTTPYGLFIQKLCAENRTWAFAEGEKVGAAKWEMLARHKFALHARPGEAFGIAVAEMAKAGCVTFVPEYGSPAEIVDNETLCYRDEDDAVRKIDRVLRNKSLQREISGALAQRARRYSHERFMTEFRSVVERFAEWQLERRSALPARPPRSEGW